MWMFFAAARASIPGPLLTSAEWDHVVQSLRLTGQQAKIVELLLRGNKDKQIAAGMGLSNWTVRTQLTRLFRRLDVADRVGLVLRVFRIAHRRGE